jgi:hypothetical protein
MGKLGLHNKYLVRRRDGSSRRGQKHYGCDYFVLDWKHDKFAVAAMTAYADACEREHPALAIELRDRIEEAKQWHAVSPFVSAPDADNGGKT